MVYQAREKKKLKSVKKSMKKIIPPTTPDMQRCVSTTVLVLVALVLGTAFAYGGGKNTGCACTVSFTGGADKSCTASCTGGVVHDGFTRTSTSITNTDGGHTYFTISGNITNNCPVCGSSYGCPTIPYAYWYVVRTDVTPNVRILGAIVPSNTANKPLIVPSGSVINTVPYVGSFPAGATFVVEAVISANGGSGNCQASLSNVELDVSQPAKKRDAPSDAIRLPFVAEEKQQQ